jgi:hypothetical protein
MNADNLEKDCWLKKFADNTEGKDADGRADVLEGDTELDSCHSVAAEQGQVLWLFMGVRVRICSWVCVCECCVQRVPRGVHGVAWGQRESKSAICTRSFPGLGFRL